MAQDQVSTRSNGPHAGSPVPVVIVEEHHEAFYVWHKAIANGWMKAAGNTLVHFDEHHDLCLPVLRTPVSAVRTPEHVAQFTYGELGIGSFIWPAVYSGMFDQCFWLRRAAGQRGAERLSITTKDERQLEFAIRKARGDCNLTLIRLRTDDEVSPPDGFVLDVDLDYFVCNKPRPRFEIEITQAAYQRYLDDPYYYLRIPSPEVTVEQRNGSYVIVLGDDPVPDPDAATPAELDARIDDACGYIARAFGPPSVVVVCRSVHSGYTPATEARRLERRLLDRLGDLFAIDEIHLPDLLPSGMGVDALLGHAYTGLR